ncbi:MAG: 30S ribosome-binding factor RbfA [Gammaproteobacteria bacterium]|nr:30S ribosome-binding factor RbfA [Gammaproteobacteria bacterium]
MRRVRVLNRAQSFGREQRVAEFLRRELGDLIRTKMRDPRIDTRNILLNDVRVSRDLRFADIYLRDCKPDGPQPDILIEVFQKAAGFLRTELSQRHSMRHTPELRFIYDSLEEQGGTIDSLIDRAVDIETHTEQSACD